jgi:hypothetical protein
MLNKYKFIFLRKFIKSRIHISNIIYFKIRKINFFQINIHKFTSFILKDLKCDKSKKANLIKKK